MHEFARGSEAKVEVQVQETYQGKTAIILVEISQPQP